jgi:ActR/RegA family two-component response regulator
MALVFLIGSDDPLLEGIAQTLAASGHQPRISHTIPEALDVARSDPPLAAVVERSLAEPPPKEPLPVSVQRLVMAELTLPLERHRLIALIHRMEERAQATGRGRRGHDTPPEHHAAP